MNIGTPIIGPPIPIHHTEYLSQVTSEQCLIILLARDRSPKWREFLETRPPMEPWWFNEIVDWLVENYPEDFINPR